MCLLRVLLLGVLLYPGKGKPVWEKIFTRPGSDLLLPIIRHLTLNHPDTKRCDLIIWTHSRPEPQEIIAEHRNCKPSDVRYFPNTRMSVNGSLIISNVTRRNDGRYWADILNSTGDRITTDHYFVHVEGNGVQEEIFTRPGSDLLFPIRRHLTLNRTDYRCDWFCWFYKKPSGSWKEITEHRYCDLYDDRYFPNTRISENGSLIISNVILRNDGEYRMHIHSTGYIIEDYYYIVHVEGNGDQEEIFTRPGSDLLLPIRIHLTLNHPDIRRCDGFYWSYKKPSGSWEVIAAHRYCYLSDDRYFPNTWISEDGSLIISNVILENDGEYGVDIYNSTGDTIQTDLYTVHVEGNAVWEEIFTRPGSDLLFPIRHHLILNHPDRRRCDEFTWYYKKPSGSGERIAQHRNCDLSDVRYFPNTWISENGSLIIFNVILRNEGIYNVEIYNSTGNFIQSDYYTVHVEVPVSVPVLRVSCPHNGSAEISCRVEAGTKPNISLSVIGGSKGKYFTSANNITAIVESPGPWNITCTARNSVSQSEESRAGVTCPDPVLDMRCLQNGSAEISCGVKNGTDPSIYLTVSGELEVYNVTSSERAARVTVPPVSPPDSWNIRCSAKNGISERSTNQTYDTCPVPVSVPVLHVSCLRNGSAEITCRVEAGTKPNIHLSIIGGSQGNYSTSANNITAIVKPPGPWNITCAVENGVSRSEESRAGVTCPVPVSDPVLDMRCLQNGSAEISCGVKNGTDPSIYLTVSGELEVYNVTSSERTARVTVPPVSPPDSWNIRCSAKNDISERSTNQKYDTCPVPVSDPVLDMRCLQNGSAEISCEVKNGTDPSIYLTVSGELEEYDVTSSERTARVTVPPVSSPDSWNIRCSAKNDISERSTNQTYDTCPVPVSVPVPHVSCLRNGSAEITCRVEAGTKPNIRLSVIGGSQGNYSTSANNITAIVEPPGPWNIICTVENAVSRSEESRAVVTCPEESRCGMSV